MSIRFLISWTAAVLMLSSAQPAEASAIEVNAPGPAAETTLDSPQPTNLSPDSLNPEMVNPSSLDTNNSGLPASTAIVVAFPNVVEFDVGQNQNLPITLLLAQPILDGYGNVMVPANSPVSAHLLPKDGGAQILADSLIVNGQLLPIQASSTIIPGRTITLSDSNAQAQKNAPAYSHLGSSLLGAFTNGDPDKMIQGGLIGHGVGILSGMFSPETVRLVAIPENSVYILTLQSALSPGPAAAANPPLASPSDP